MRRAGTELTIPIRKTTREVCEKQREVANEVRTLMGKMTKMQVLVDKWVETKNRLVEEVSGLGEFEAWARKIEGDLKEIDALQQHASKEGREYAELAKRKKKRGAYS
eukprot:g339.t1